MNQRLCGRLLFSGLLLLLPRSVVAGVAASTSTTTSTTLALAEEPDPAADDAGAGGEQDGAVSGGIAPPAAGSGTVCQVTFSLTNAVDLGSLQFRSNDNGAGGLFDGGSSGNCSSLTDSPDLITSILNDTAQKRLTVGMISLSGFQGPGELLRCSFTASSTLPATSSFPVDVLEASTPDVDPTTAQVVASSVSCLTNGCGDANGDGSISASDALFALKASVGSRSCSLSVCDVTGDGKTSASDALAILRYAVGSGTLNCSGGGSPSAPGGLGASTISSSQIDLGWNDNSSNETGFKIERKTGSGGSYSQIATVGAGVTSYSSTGLSSSTTYYYRVRATNGSGDSGYSNEASATTSAVVVTPNAPSGLAATAETYSDIRLNWSDNSSNETGFEVQSKIGSGGSYVSLGTVAADSTAVIVQNSEANTTYSFRVRAVNGAGSSAWSSEAWATTATPLNNAVSISGSTSWQVSGGYIQVHVDEIRNTTNNYTSGTLRISVVATSTPFLGRSSLYGYHLMDYQLNPLPPGYHYTNVDVTLPVQWPPSGDYYTVLIVSEWNGSQFLIDDYVPYQGTDHF